jgi:hypothetical protein
VAAELVEKMGADVLGKVERRWPVKHHALGACLVWTGAKGPHATKGPYGRLCWRHTAIREPPRPLRCWAVESVPVRLYLKTIV